MATTYKIAAIPGDGIGVDITDVLDGVGERMESDDFAWVVMAVRIQREVGGNLAEILEGLSKVIRARFKLFRRVKAITAEAKWSGTFLSGFPLLALVTINILEPNYYDDVKETAVFVPACLIVAAFLTVNILVMRALVNIKV